MDVEERVEGLEILPGSPVGGESGWGDALEDGLTGECEEVMERMVYWNVISEKGGTGVGVWSAPGAKLLNLWKEKRESASAMALL